MDGDETLPRVVFLVLLVLRCWFFTRFYNSLSLCSIEITFLLYSFSTLFLNAMFRHTFLTLLREYSPPSEVEQMKRDQTIAFVEAHTDCFRRELLTGHVTGSAWVVNPKRDKVLLTHHRKLDKWLQLGGHCDGDYDVLRVALREAVEESGVFDIIPVHPDIFDLDILLVPERRTATVFEPEHWHYDARFLLLADDTVPLQITPESNDLRWVPLNEVERLTEEESVLRMVRKVLHH
jgi:8-oxo-dGTP pyrophosphatase MutT (NUDIX family)